MKIVYIDNIKDIVFTEEERQAMCHLASAFDKILENVKEEETIYLCDGFSKDYSELDTATDILYSFAKGNPYVS